MTEPATPFWQGYQREPVTVVHLASALKRAMFRHPEARLGQLINVALNGVPLTAMWDEDLAEALNAIAEGREP